MILIVGGTGTVGSELVQQLLQQGRTVRVFTRDERKIAHLGSRIEVAVGDLDHPVTLDAAMQGVDRLFLITRTTPQDSSVLDVAKRFGVQHIVKLSTLESEDAAIQIGKWSRERELLIEASGLAWTFLRPGMFMTNTIGWWADSIKRRGTVFFPGGTSQIAPIHPRDIAAVAAAALTQPGHEGQSYMLTGPELLTMDQMIQIIARLLGKQLTYVSIAPAEAGQWMLQGGMREDFVAPIVELLTMISENRAAIVTDTVERVTGRPARTYEEWGRENIAAFQA